MFHIFRTCFCQHLHPLYLPNTGFCFIQKNVGCNKIFGVNCLGTGINFIFLHLWKQGSYWCLDPFGTGFHDQLYPYLLILKRSPWSCLGNGCWCVSIIFFTILVPWTCFSLCLYADSCHVCFKVSSALRITSCQAGMSLRGWYIGLSSRAAGSLADFHSLPFIWSCVLFHSQFPSPSETHSFPSCPSFCFALSLPHILPLFHLKSYHQLPSANHFLSRELWIKFKSVEFRLPPSCSLPTPCVSLLLTFSHRELWPHTHITPPLIHELLAYLTELSAFHRVSIVSQSFSDGWKKRSLITVLDDYMYVDSQSGAPSDAWTDRQSFLYPFSLSSGRNGDITLQYCVLQT